MTKRKTLPVAKQVIDPYTKRNARFGKRLIDFDTGSAELENQHKEWLNQTMLIAKRNSELCIVVVGYASKLGDKKKNRDLSNKRVTSVVNFIQKYDSRVLQNTEMYWCGEDESEGGEKNDAPAWRAVEVFVYMESCQKAGIRKGPPPKNWKRIPPRVIPPLPGGNRSLDWSIANPGGGQATVAVVSGGFNIFFIRNDITKEERGYINPCGGGAAGVGLKLKGLKGVAKLIFETIMSSITASSLSYTSVIRPSADLIKPLSYPITWQEIESCLVSVPTAGAGYAVSRLTFNCPGVYHYGPSGVPIKTPMDLFTIRSTGWNLQAGVGATAGPLIRVG